jgi:hypothetical protein
MHTTRLSTTRDLYILQLLYLGGLLYMFFLLWLVGVNEEHPTACMAFIVEWWIGSMAAITLFQYNTIDPSVRDRRAVLLSVLALVSQTATMAVLSGLFLQIGLGWTLLFSVMTVASLGTQALFTRHFVGVNNGGELTSVVVLDKIDIY